MIKFNEYPYQRLYNNITRFDSYKEAEVETAYNTSYIASSSGLLDVIKARNTDGIIIYRDSKNREFLFLQEVKNGNYFGKTPCSLAKQLGQAIYYYFYNWKFKYGDNANIVAIIINTENFFGYVKIKDIQDILNDLEPLYRNTKIKSACHIREDSAIINYLYSSIASKQIDLNITDLHYRIELSDLYNKAFN